MCSRKLLEFNLASDYEFKIEEQHLQQGISVLKRRQKYLMFSMKCILTVAVLLGISYPLQQNYLYGLWGLSHEIYYIHIVPELVLADVHSNDYFFNLISWFLWSGFKVIISFVGAFFLVHYLKKISVLKLKNRSIILKFIRWILAFVFIWMGLTYIQYGGKDKQSADLVRIVKYESNINESEIAQYLKKNDMAKPIKDYTLAQTALLHEPADYELANIFTQALMDAEKSDKNFSNYGFKPEQIWTLQNQIYGESKTDLAKQFDLKAVKVEIYTRYLQLLTIILIVISILSSLIIFFIFNNLKKRILRIEQRI